MPFAATRMDLEMIILSEKKSERERQMTCDVIYMLSLKCDTNGFIHKTERDSQT